MEISTFELLAKPIAPSVPTAPELTPVLRRVVQGYFLTISNLEAIDLRYRIEFAVSLPVPPDPNKIPIDGVNVRLIIDVEGANTFIPLTQIGSSNIYRGFFRIPAGKTASVELLPLVPAVLTSGSLEVRGYVSLFLQPRRFFPGPVPPTKQGARVLLNPEIRGTFLPNGFPGVVGDLDFDQINYTLAIASGKALNVLPPAISGPIIIDPPIILPVLEELRDGNLELASSDADNSEKAQMLVQLLAELEPNEANLKALNTVMNKFDIPVKMSHC
ncbi:MULTISPECIES: hypothetical protein [unclassified Microcoleus]|jgi:hypothetical protein|uniref:hypothetical protein n=1 Tax=unclassified Microcoleus TaxID=2642155 RepID=UPI001DD71FB9|nr:MULTISPECIES: hypothetical protein [unclassified Microcoleus]MCC3568819.1 hypothetical protein [Microcoleus sp. PH2017_31_RDM_U_A]MCC3581570.1 hypothetical protein [Microcoleus sp. PH2017_32_RDM_D_A]MCC3588052.1 hypothetical protein [Microcoleus sp. PH2017_30_WIL_O_A]MCC3594254.1 hypothetical protein [Microcoleus sp. PH2017_28_MFU_U_A]MCC3619159.1 hypothetical protein [Microcoleus sp. PH2017_38_RDM_U_B]